MTENSLRLRRLPNFSAYQERHWPDTSRMVQFGGSMWAAGSGNHAGCLPRRTFSNSSTVRKEGMCHVGLQAER